MPPLIVGIHADPITHKIPGGIGVYVRRLVEQLMRSEDLSVRLLAVRPVPPDPAEWWKPGWSRPSPALARVPLQLLYASWNYLALPRIRAQLDLVHATGLVIPPVAGARLVATVHDVAVDLMPDVVPGNWRRIYARGLRIALAEAKVLCVVSQSVKSQLSEMYSVEPDRMVVTPEAANVTPNDYRDNSALDKLGVGRRFILTVGTVEPRKNQKLLLEAFAEAAPMLDGMQLVIAGSPGWGSTDTLKTIEKLHLEGLVILTGSISASALAALYAKATIFAMPSLYEGFGIPLVEAMGFGVPCVASEDPALREAGGEAAAYLDAKDAAAWAKELGRLAQDEQGREALAAAGRSRALEFSWEKTARATLNAYRKAAA